MPELSSSTIGQLITFLRKRDYALLRELGSGACGQTVLLHDDQIDEHFVCKKYAPSSEAHREELFSSFVREIKLLHKLQHANVVRVFNYYLYPDNYTGYILMEYIDGMDIDSYAAKNPELLSDLFVQTVNGFAYLESRSVLHRDIRPMNVLVRDDGVVKIIDLGFGKHVQTPTDFGKSISLNWWCDTPAEFASQRYDFGTEVYFVGKLFEKMLLENSISEFKFKDLLRQMCQHEPADRIKGFAAVERAIGTDQFFESDFSQNEMLTYRAFADELGAVVTKVQRGTKYDDDANAVIRKLDDVYRRFMLEESVPDNSLVIGCIIDGSYYYSRRTYMTVASVRDFLRLMRSVSDEKKRVILANIHTRLDAIERYFPPQSGDNDIPF